MPVGKLLVAGSSPARGPPKSHTSEAIFQDRFRRLALLVATRLDNFDFTATGHAVVLTVGMLLSSRFHSPARWSPPALDAAAAGVAFGDTALVAVVRGRSGYRTRHSADRALRMFSGEPREQLRAGSEQRYGDRGPAPFGN